MSSRKQIVNENLQWPEIEEKTSEQVLEMLETHLRKHPDLRRRKNPPKKIRNKKKTKPQEEKSIEESKEKQNKREISVEAESIKRRIRIGINVITKTLEREPANVAFVLVCRSCKPLAVLTRHIQLMCAMEGVPAGCVHNLSTRLQKILNIGSVRALLVRKTDEKAATQPNETIESMFTEWSRRVPPLLPALKNPFGQIETIPGGGSIVSLIEEIKRECRIDEEDGGAGGEMEIDDNQVELKYTRDLEDEEEKEDDEFGDDYLRVGSSRKQPKWIEFDNENADNHFILFNDSYEKKRRREASKRMEF